ncbi:sialate O-acetylesterase [Chitinophaga sp. Ak27]|uniref:sialate O-acetylesterase n=1 Tax=Chitinophaga sp. Ak27 TaxID=2726116 RepID=UPI00145E08D1|nr:sialate O-acetylesterase [Chitinophaga sp. Ak27]NLU90491.1 sialate O-acetylesterase [Chitinophaga sp. Ak27]
MNKFFITIGLLAVSLGASAQLQLDRFFGSGMVLQREMPIRFSGTGTPGRAIVLYFGSKEVSTQVDARGRWQAYLPPAPANAAGQQLIVRMDTCRLVLHDILIGDIWVCAGQSNMEFMLKSDQNAAEALQQAGIPMLRLLNEVKQTSTYNSSYQLKDIAALYPENYYNGQWKVSDKDAAMGFSAVAFYFGKALVQQLKVPVGLIHVAVGGSPTEAWVRPASVQGDTALQKIFDSDWWNNLVLEPWCIQRGHENLDSLLKQGVVLPKDSLGYQHPFKPGFLYQAAIAPLTDFAIKGVIWYQGESNALSADRVTQHEALFKVLVTDWRRQWHQPALPFYYCQLSSISTESGYHSEYWPVFRDSQRRLTDSLPHTGMAVTSDVGDRTNVHPRDKRTVGERLALVALKDTYHQQVASTGPKPVKAVLRRQKVVVTFSDVEGKLKTADGKPLRGFSLDNGGPVPAIIRGNTVVIGVNGKVQILQYGWSPYTDANLCNGVGLPASTFALPVQ